MEHWKIEQSARALQREIWQHRDRLWQSVDIPPVNRMFTPEVGAKVLGFDLCAVPDLGAFGDGQFRFKVAGTVDRNQRKIQISQRFDPRVQRFTAGHEIGHIDLHPASVVMHRDRALNGLGLSAGRAPLEKQADYYAACYLAPRKVVQDAFEERFGPIDQFRFGDDEAFGLCPTNPHSLMSSSEDSLDWEMTLAKTIRYQGRFFESLSDYFLLSAQTIAIRLREVGLRHGGQISDL